MSKGLVPRAACRQELFHALDVHMDVGRRCLLATFADEHVASERLANLDHHRLLLDAPPGFTHSLHSFETLRRQGECQV